MLISARFIYSSQMHNFIETVTVCALRRYEHCLPRSSITPPGACAFRWGGCGIVCFVVWAPIPVAVPPRVLGRPPGILWLSPSVVC